MVTFNTLSPINPFQIAQNKQALTMSAIEKQLTTSKIKFSKNSNNELTIPPEIWRELATQKATATVLRQLQIPITNNDLSDGEAASYYDPGAEWVVLNGQPGTYQRGTYSSPVKENTLYQVGTQLKIVSGWQSGFVAQMTAEGLVIKPK